MRYLFFLSALVLTLASCSNVAFVKPQPEGIEALAEIPENLQGIYAFDTASCTACDSIIVTSNTIGEDTLGKNLIVKKRGNYYYLNFLEENGYDLTVVKVIQFLNYEFFKIYHPNISEKNAYFFDVIKVEASSISNKYLIDNVSINQMRIMLRKTKDNHKLIRIK